MLRSAAHGRQRRHPGWGQQAVPTR